MFQVKRATLSHLDSLLLFGRAEYCRTFQHLYDEKDLNKYLEEAYEPSLYQKWIESPSYHILMVENGGSGSLMGTIVAGPCTLPLEQCSVANQPSLLSNPAEIKRLYVHPDYFGKGLAEQLLQSSIQVLREKGHANIYLGVYTENYRAVKFYTKHHFQKVGEYSFQVGDRYDIDMIMRLEDGK